jgi:DNA-binding transcriptional ArsR family regulator
MKDEKMRIVPEKRERLYFKVYLDMWDNDLLSPVERYVYLTLKRYADVRTGEGMVYPTIEDICKKVGKNRKTVSKYLKSLQDKGVIEIRRRGQGKNNLYVIKDRSSMWKSETVEELQAAAEETALDKAIRLVESAGGKVSFPDKEKAPKPNAKPTTAADGLGAKSNKPINNPTGNYSKSQGRKPKNQKNSFHNCEQRDYGNGFYDALEQRLTGKKGV